MDNSQHNSFTQYRAHLHWVVFVLPLLLLIAGLIVEHFHRYVGYVGLMLMGMGAMLFVLNLLTFTSSFITIEESGVLFRSGILVQDTMEIKFTKIESIDIRQNILGSMLDYGSIIVTGTGGTRNFLHYVAAPLTCRRLLEQAMQRSK